MVPDRRNRPLLCGRKRGETPQPRFNPRALAKPKLCAYIVRAELRGLCRISIPGALSISKGAVPGLVRGLGHMAPTYIVGFPGSISHGSVAPHLLFSGWLDQCCEPACFLFEPASCQSSSSPAGFGMSRQGDPRHSEPICRPSGQRRAEARQS